MKRSRLMRALITAAMLFGVDHAAQANDRTLRTGPDDSYVIFQNGGNASAVWLASSPGAPNVLPQAKAYWVLDALIDDAHKLWLAVAPKAREEAVHIWHIDGEKKRDIVIADSSATSEAKLLKRDGAIYLATSEGLWSIEGTGAKKRNTWAPNNYAFYAATLSATRGGFMLLAPGFNTCGSSDLLEELWQYEPEADGKMARRAIPMPPMNSAWLGADGVRYATDCEKDVGLIARHTSGKNWPIIHREPAPNCLHHLEQNGRFTIAMFGKSLVRVHEGRAERIGVADKSPAKIEAFYPDARGRAVVLHEDGAIVRYSSQKPSEVLAHLTANREANQ